ncbi:CP2 transcription factor-domain-containing protein [Stachybotrys elegans]|uniref:CP2 transcription factor-domain-containing protein n=1 Tax=Stachybotrys elegans TaxID=80388 RepID=A0A8K0WUA8_9HYPO|nr:CP2 transcription factor-domain-containing protein [Stachybotrys elegans]
MFRSRTSSQKPGDELLANFREQFPQVAATSTAGTTAPAISQTAAPGDNILLSNQHQQPTQPIDTDAFRDQDPTPRASNEPWRFTPSLLDPTSYSFNTFANAPPGYYTPTPGGTNTLFHSQAGDLHTPTLSLLPGGMGTPLSMPASGGVMQPTTAGMMDMGGFQALQPHQFHHFNPFVQAPPPQPTFAPSSFVHQDTGYETMDQDGSPIDSDGADKRMTSIDSAFHTASPVAGALQARHLGGMHMNHGLPPSAEKFRFHSTLNAPTAMIKQADEIPVTYLNKGQAYSLTICDTNATIPIAPGTKYRTFVRISFEDEQQRQKPGVCWSLWKEGRGTNEAHQRGGKLQAVEYVEAGQPAEGDDKRTRVELEYYSFDGFSVIWTPGLNGSPEVNIAVRFNFLSTDFSHSKGVKGIPVRLCAKTSPFPTDQSQPAADANPEICFCKVKLFRDHGAERKLSNDVAHVKKSIDKLKQQIAQAESGMKDFGKRKRSSGMPKPSDPQRPGKAPKHKRTWSMSSTSSANGGSGRLTVEEDLAVKLQTLQDMFTSTRPVSVLYLRGEEQDDPDLHPVAMPGDMSPPRKVDSAREGPNWQARSSRSSVTGSIISPSPSSVSLASQVSAVGAGGHWQNFDSVAEGSRKGSDQPTKVSKTDDDGNLSGWIEALGVDHSYRPPAERSPRPIACFYVKKRGGAETEKAEYYRALYLTQRNLQELNDRIAIKWGLDSSRIIKTIHVLQSGLEVEVDDDVVRELKEGQDIILEVEETTEQAPPLKREWEMSLDTHDTPGSDEAGSTTRNGLSLRLIF